MGVYIQLYVSGFANVLPTYKIFVANSCYNKREFEKVFTRSILCYFSQKRHNLTGYATKIPLFLRMKSV